MRLKSTLVAVGLALAMPLTAVAEDVEFMTWTYTEENGRPFIDEMINSFDGTVEPVGYAWGEMTRNTFLRARTNTLPDISQVQARLLPTLANIDQMVDLNTVFDRAELEAKFPPGFLAFGEIDGRQMALPWIGGTIGMVANEQVMKAAGIAKTPRSLDEFTAALEAIRDAVPNSVPYGLATKNNNSIVLDYLIWVWTHGGDVIVDGKPMVNSPEGVAALQYMVMLVEERLAAPEIDRPDARRLFGQEAMGFYFDAPSAISFAREFSGDSDYGQYVQPMATPVAMEGADPVSIQWGHVLVMYGDENGSADSASAGFLMHLLSDDVLVPYASAKGVLPTTTSGQASAEITGDAYLAAWAQNAGVPRRNTIAGLSNGAEVGTIIGEEVQAAILSQKSAEEAANDMQARLEDA
ncbi:MAG: extracellular solute-binding protein, partial [Chloroflexota bacterium]